jgi:3-deoxy-manno-octulosonate cytidylyltransferase (CMP-KDO synthetase)
MSDIVVIPARMGSSRFPGKPLARILGKPMLGWVISHAADAVGRENTYVASCDEEIISYADSLSVRGILTADTHERASDRTAEAVDYLESEGNRIRHVLMLQGDEPAIPAPALLSVFERLNADDAVEIVNLTGSLASTKGVSDPNAIKVVARFDGTALYFSRLPIPYGGGIEEGSFRKQVCAIGFTRDALRRFSALGEGRLERDESIDMLRWLEHGNNIHLVEISLETHPVDVKEDIEVVESILASRSKI